MVVGAGAFGVSTAHELAARGWEVDLLDPGPVPHPLAASTDISKAVRMDYGSDELYTELASRAIEAWRRLDDEALAENGSRLFHEDGFLLMTRERWSDESFERRGFELLTRRGCPVERIDSAELRRRFPAWRAEGFSAGYFNPRAGWVEAGKAMRRLADLAVAAGVRLRLARAVALDERDGRVRGVTTDAGETFEGDVVVVAAGAWTPTIVPELREVMWATAQPVLHFRPRDTAPFDAEHFPVWGADITRTGWYGFPVNDEGIVKVGNHGPGRRIDPDAPRRLDRYVEDRCRVFLRGAFPALADAPLTAGRVCLYCDTFDGDFWIDRHPDRPGLVVASGGSGHGFKFATVIGDVVADVVEESPNPFASRFAWRERGGLRREQARWSGPTD